MTHRSLHKFFFRARTLQSVVENKLKILGEAWDKMGLAPDALRQRHATVETSINNVLKAMAAEEQGFIKELCDAIEDHLEKRDKLARVRIPAM